MAMQDLFQALQMFKEGVQGAATFSAVNQATSQMEQIKQSAVDEAQKRQQLQDLSNQTALRLTGLGANGTQIQSAFNAIAPPNFGSAEQLQLEGALSGNQQYTQQAAGIINERDTKKATAEELDFKRKLYLQDRLLRGQLLQEQAKLSLKKPELSSDELGFQTNVQVADTLLNDLESTIKDKGTFESGWGTKAKKSASAKLDSIPYQLAITYAKIVDPASVAREGEVAAAQKYMLNLGMFANQDKALEAISNMKSTINTYKSARSNTQAAAGIRPVSPQATAAPVVKTRRLKSGQLVPVQFNPQTNAWDPVK